MPGTYRYAKSVPAVRRGNVRGGGHGPLSGGHGGTRGRGAGAVTGTVVVIDGAPLTCAAVAAVARRQAGVAVGERAVTAARPARPRR